MSKCTAPEISTFPEFLRNLVDGRKVTLLAKAYGVGFEKGVHRIPGHFDDAKIPIETNSGRLASCTTAEAAEKRRGAGDGQVLALVSWLLQGCTGPVLDAQRQLHLSIRRHREQPVPLSFDRESGNPAGYLPRMDLLGVRGRFGFLFFTEAVKATRPVYTWTGNSIFARMWARCRVIAVESVTC